MEASDEIDGPASRETAPRKVDRPQVFVAPEGQSLEEWLKSIPKDFTPTSVQVVFPKRKQPSEG